MNVFSREFIHEEIEYFNDYGCLDDANSQTVYRNIKINFCEKFKIKFNEKDLTK